MRDVLISFRNSKKLKLFDDKLIENKMIQKKEINRLIITLLKW